MSKLRSMVNETREAHNNVRIKVQEAALKKHEKAKEVKLESQFMKKQMNKMDKMYLRRAQEKRFEQQVMQEASKIRQEQNLVNKLES